MKQKVECCIVHKTTTGYGEGSELIYLSNFYVAVPRLSIARCTQIMMRYLYNTTQLDLGSLGNSLVFLALKLFSYFYTFACFCVLSLPCLS